MPITASSTKHFSLEPGTAWPSFEQFRTQGSNALRDIQPGRVGTLSTKQGNFRILTEADFQRVYGLAREVERLSGTLRVVIAAARGVQKNRDEVSLETLTAAVMLLDDLPSLPTRTAIEPMQPEGIAVEDVDDLDLDRVPRPDLERAG